MSRFEQASRPIQCRSRTGSVSFQCVLRRRPGTGAIITVRKTFKRMLHWPCGGRASRIRRPCKRYTEFEFGGPPCSWPFVGGVIERENVRAWRLCSHFAFQAHCTESVNLHSQAPGASASGTLAVTGCRWLSLAPSLAAGWRTVASQAVALAPRQAAGWRTAVSRPVREDRGSMALGFGPSDLLSNPDLLQITAGLQPL